MKQLYFWVISSFPNQNFSFLATVTVPFELFKVFFILSPLPSKSLLFPNQRSVH